MTSPAEPSPRVGRDTAVMAVGTTLSRTTGVVRTFALAYALGSLALADAYNLANTIPNIINDIVLGGIVSATFIPVFVTRLSTRPEDEAWDAISAVTSVTLIVLGAATVAFFALTPLVIVATTALNHSAHAAQTRHVATELLLLFVPQLACYGFVSLGTALLNARRRFAAPMFAPIANNVVLIAVLLVFGTLVRQRSVSAVADHRGQLLLLGLGTTLGVVVQAGFMIPSLRRAGLRLRWRPDFHHEAVRTILRLSGWTFGLVVANQLALLVVLSMSENVGPGAVSAYTYAYTFFQLPYGVVAVSIMAATAPELTTHWAMGDTVAFRRRMAVGLRAMLAVIIPAAAGLLVLARPLVALLLGHGASTTVNTVPTASSLAMLALGLPGFCLFLYAVRVLQSVQDLRSAFWLYVLENGINVVLAVTLAGPLGVRGIALSVSVAYTIASLAALARVRSRVQGLGAQWLTRPLVHVLLACVALVVGAVLGSNFTASQTGFGLLARVALGVGAGALAYVFAAGILARLTGRPDVRDPDGTSGPGRRRRGRVRQVAPPPPEPLPPAGRPPYRPESLGPTRSPGPGGSAHGRLGP
ncbi:MAG: murein biosynthesis integral membrane protein MurJ [Acidimicrobiales bacterium]